MSFSPRSPASPNHAVTTCAQRSDAQIIVSPADLAEIKQRPISATAASSEKALQQMQLLGGRAPGKPENKSSILTLGLSVHSAPVEMREKLAVPQDQWPEAIQQLCSYPHIEEAAVLSTCNRMEIYVVALSHNRGVREVEEWMCQYSGLALEELRPHLFLLKDQDATSHVLQVSAGLDSLVLGEGQILAQVKAVHEVGSTAKGFGRHLKGLFMAAITAGKRVRTETSIASGAVSVSSAAAELALMKLPTGNYDDARICIIGAGKMTRLLVKHLVSKNCTNMVIVNRSRPRVEELQADFPEANIELRLMDSLKEEVANADVIFFASSAEDPLVNKADIEAMPLCPDVVGGVRRLFDIAVPRNVDSDINELSTAHVFNVDDLREVVDANKDARNRAAEEAKELLKEEQSSFEAWRDSLETVPTIKRLRTKAEDIRTQELEKALKKMGDGLTKKQRRAVEDLSRGIVNKMLHGPMQSLRSDGSDARTVNETIVNMHALERMFDLKPEEATAHVWEAKGRD